MFKRSHKEPVPVKSGIDILLETSPWRMSAEERAEMTISCDDTDYIPKVPKSGSLTRLNGKEVQLMHNGLFVLSGGYHGEWMTQIIKKLRGHHEPQEEKAFYEVIKKLSEAKQNKYYMMELGAFWAYYSMWFKHTLPNSEVFCFEPDPSNMEVGKQNAQINQLDLRFIKAAAGNEDGKTIEFTLDSDPTQTTKVNIKTVDSFVRSEKLPRVDLLHMDVQGVEVEALDGAKQLVSSGKLRFLFVSTHHYFFSNDILTHQKCMDFINKNGGHIIASHNVLESYSGDGLIVASFDKRDKDFTIKTSINTSQKSLFRPYEEDIALLLKEMDQ